VAEALAEFQCRGQMLASEFPFAEPQVGESAKFYEDTAPPARVP